MKRIAFSLLATALLAGPVLADPPPHARNDHDNPGKGHAKGHKKHHVKGERLEREYWGERVDYHHHHLQAPPPGHEWRRVDDEYILIAVATGIIASVIAANY